METGLTGGRGYYIATARSRLDGRASLQLAKGNPMTRSNRVGAVKNVKLRSDKPARIHLGEGTIPAPVKVALSKPAKSQFGEGSVPAPVKVALSKPAKVQFGEGTISPLVKRVVSVVR